MGLQVHISIVQIWNMSRCKYVGYQSIASSIIMLHDTRDVFVPNMSILHQFLTDIVTLPGKVFNTVG